MRASGSLGRLETFRLYVERVKCFPPRLTRVGRHSICHIPLPIHLFFAFHLRTFPKLYDTQGDAFTCIPPFRRSAVPCWMCFLCLTEYRSFPVGCPLSPAPCRLQAAEPYIYSCLEEAHSPGATPLVRGLEVPPLSMTKPRGCRGFGR